MTEMAILKESIHGVAMGIQHSLFLPQEQYGEIRSTPAKRKNGEMGEHHSLHIIKKAQYIYRVKPFAQKQQKQDPIRNTTSLAIDRTTDAEYKKA